MAVVDSSQPADQIVRLQDYLDDKLQTGADFETLDTLLENVRRQQELLKKQLSDAQQESQEAQQKSREHAFTLREKAEAFQHEQSDIDRTLMIVTQSETSDEAVGRFGGVMDTLRRFDLANEYVELLQQVDAVSSSCLAQLKNDIDAAVSDYKRLQNLATILQSLQETADGAAPYLVDLVSQTASSCRDHTLKHISSELVKVLKKIGWPRTDSSIPPALQDEWATHIKRLLDLQLPELLATEADNQQKTSKEEPAVLLPYQIILQPLGQRFQYHFSGDRMTNRIDKPEYFLSHTFDLINDYAVFFQSNMQALLIRCFRDTDLAFTPAYIDASSALINAVLPLAKQKLSSILPEVSRQPNLFSNLIHEVMAFDNRLSEEWKYCPLSPSVPFRGLAHHVTSTLGYFQAWLAVERDFALARYDAIISDRSTGFIDYDSVDSSTTKPTKAAIRVNDLLETVTDRYRPLSSFYQKMTFLIDVQIAIFDRFHGRLNESLEAYLTRTSTVARHVHGVSNADTAELSGVKGLERLCRVYGSAEYLEKAMGDWSEDVFFLDLWEELQYRSQNPGLMKGDFTMSEIAAKTSSTIVDGTSSADEVHGALFDETAASYRRLRVRSEQVLIEAVTYDIRNALRPYGRVNTWATMSSFGNEASLTAELDGPIRLMDEYLTFLAKALGRIPLRRVSRQLGHSIQTFLWDTVLSRHSFSTAGATQFNSDVNGLWRVIDRHVGNGQGRAGMVRLAEGLTLLGLPVKGEIPVNMNESAAANQLQGKKWGLFEIERRVFASNESAREVLDDLGLEVLSESDARDVLKKRVELAS